jgi:hypothetical protein
MALTTVSTDAVVHRHILKATDLTDGISRLLTGQTTLLTPQVLLNALTSITNSDILTEELGIVTVSILAHCSVLSSLV